MWIVTYRDFVVSIGISGDEEAFIHPSSKVYIFFFENNSLDLLAFLFLRLEIKIIDGLNLFHIGLYGLSILPILR